MAKSNVTPTTQNLVNNVVLTAGQKAAATRLANRRRNRLTAIAQKAWATRRQNAANVVESTTSTTTPSN